ncbi:MAG: hypothetical protein AAF355_12650, partial [Myxococcota bacterium]
HHCLDVTFGEDRRGIRKKNGAQNFALINRYAVSILEMRPCQNECSDEKAKSGLEPILFH